MTGRMALAGVARVKNEADIIEQFVRHHVALLDHLVVADNASSDGTREILAALVTEGLPLTVLDDAVFALRQSEIMTYLVRAAFAQLGAARVAVLDADEFVVVRDREALDAALARIPWETHGLVPWRTYVPCAADDRFEADVLRRIVHRRRCEAVSEVKVLVSASLVRDPSAVVIQGNHGVAGGPGTTHAVLDGVALAHLPVRSAAQLTVKALIGWNAYIAMGHHDPGYGYQWQRAYASIMHAGGLGDELVRTARGGLSGRRGGSGVGRARARSAARSVDAVCGVSQPAARRRARPRARAARAANGAVVRARRRRARRAGGVCRRGRRPPVSPPIRARAACRSLWK